MIRFDVNQRESHKNRIWIQKLGRKNPKEGIDTVEEALKYFRRPIAGGNMTLTRRFIAVVIMQILYFIGGSVAADISSLMSGEIDVGQSFASTPRNC